MLMRGWELRADKVVRSIDRCWVSKRGSTDGAFLLARDEVYRVTFFIKRAVLCAHMYHSLSSASYHRLIKISFVSINCTVVATLMRNYEETYVIDRSSVSKRGSADILKHKGGRISLHDFINDGIAFRNASRRRCLINITIYRISSWKVRNL